MLYPNLNVCYRIYSRENCFLLHMCTEENAVTYTCRFPKGLLMYSLSTLTPSKPESQITVCIDSPNKKNCQNVFVFCERCKRSGDASLLFFLFSVSPSYRMTAQGFLPRNTNQTSEDLKLSSESLPLTSHQLPLSIPSILLGQRVYFLTRFLIHTKKTNMWKSTHIF